MDREMRENAFIVRQLEELVNRMAHESDEATADAIERWAELYQRPDLTEDNKSVRALMAMEKEPVEKQRKDEKCAICIDNLCNSVEVPSDHVLKPELKTTTEEFKSTVVIMPCNHRYHFFCLTLWLEKEKTCPTCRQKVKTDQELEDEERQRNIEELHNSMFS